MIDNNYIKGYTEALNHLMNTVDKLNRDLVERYNEGLETMESYNSKNWAYENVLKYTKQVIENYKLLVKDLNSKV